MLLLLVALFAHVALLHWLEERSVFVHITVSKIISPHFTLAVMSFTLSSYRVKTGHKQ